MTRTTILFFAVLAGGCSLWIEDEIGKLPLTDDGGMPPGEVCNTAQDCLDIEAEQNNCRQSCERGADGVARCNRATTERTPDGVFCGGGMTEICINATCTPRRCGDGFVDRTADPPEYCDDGNTNNADLCNNMCTRSCLPPATPSCNENSADSCSGGTQFCDQAGSTFCEVRNAAPANGTACMLPVPRVDAGGSDGGVPDAGMGRCQTGRCIPFFP